MTIAAAGLRKRDPNQDQWGRITQMARKGESLRKVANALAVALGMLLALSPSEALAGADVTSYGERVDLAGAVWVSETETGSTQLEIRVFDLDARSTSTGPINLKDPGIELFYTHRELNPESGEVVETNYEGFSGGAGVTFEFQRSMAGAEASFPLSLAGWQCVHPPAQGVVEEVECHDIGEVYVEGQIVWTGVGPVVRDAGSLRDSEPPSWMFGAHTVIADRKAQAEGTIAGDGLRLVDGTASHAVLLRGRYHEHWTFARMIP